MSSLYPKLASNPALLHNVAAASKALTALGYVAYPLLLVLLAIFDRSLLVRCIVVPAAGFITVSLFRRLYNAPRPYEAGGRPALVHKETKGKSFPSRHTFCMLMIACTWMTWHPSALPALGPLVGALLALCAALMAVFRVGLGLHFTRDVIAAAVLAAGFALIGYGMIGW